jgi:hypothetical protein
MALDNLMLVHGRIGTLDVYALAPMLVACALYLRRRLLLAAAALALAASMKLVALYLLPVLLLIELIGFGIEHPPRSRRLRRLFTRLRPLAVTATAAIAGLLLLIWLLDVLVPAYDPGSRSVYGGSPFPHVGHMFSYAAKLKSVPHATGISSSPWQWILNQKPINYARVAVNSLAGGKIVASHAIVSFRGEINPFVIFLAIPALFAAAAASWRDRDRLAIVGVAWCIGGLSRDHPAVRSARDPRGSGDRVGRRPRLRLRGSLSNPRLTRPPVRKRPATRFSAAPFWVSDLKDPERESRRSRWRLSTVSCAAPHPSSRARPRPSATEQTTPRRGWTT